MSQAKALHLAQAFLTRMGGGAEPTKLAELFSENLDWEVAGDTGALPWIGRKSGRSEVVDFVKDSAAMIERISLDVDDILASENRAVILGLLVSKSQADRQSHRDILRDHPHRCGWRDCPVPDARG